MPLTLNKVTKSTYSLGFAEKMYVNPNTFHMSVLPKSGFLETNEFYLPINEKDQVRDQVFTFEINGCGRNQVKIIFNVKYDNKTNFIGDC